jgi:uncharacterized small protein (DUF1192 family)
MEQRRQKETSLRKENNRVRAIEKLRIMRAKELKSRLAMIEDEIARRKDGMQKEIEGIQKSDDISDAKKQIMIGQVMQREIVKPEVVCTLIDICERLDKLLFRVGKE